MDSKMLRYVLKRSLLAVFTIILIITITFFVMHAVPSSPFNKQKALTESVKKALEAKYGLDKPLGQQYVQYLGNVLKLDFGDSINFRGRSVMSLVGEGFKTSGKIGLIAAMLAIVTGVVLGALAAIKRDTTLDKTILVLTTASVSLPNFVVAIILLWAFGVWWAILPTRGTDPGGLVMPVLALMLYPSAYITRLTRSSMLDVLGQDYIRPGKRRPSEERALQTCPQKCSHPRGHLCRPYDCLHRYRQLCGRADILRAGAGQVLCQQHPKFGLSHDYGHHHIPFAYHDFYDIYQ